MIDPLICLLAAATTFPSPPAPPARDAEPPAVVAVALPPSDAVQAPLWDVPLVYGDLGPMLSTAPAGPATTEAKILATDLDALDDDAPPVEHLAAPVSLPE